MAEIPSLNEVCMHSKFLTPDSELFLKDHLGIPDVDIHNWRLAIKGMVSKPRVFSLLDIQQLPQHEIMAFHKCAGSPVDPDEPTPRDVGNVVWSGARLKDILGLCQLMPSASYVWSQGADFGSYRGAAPQFYSKDLQISKAMSGDAIVATGMNGAPISKLRGGPVRLIAPGFYATNLVKWLKSIQVEDTRSQSLFTTKYYNDVLPSSDGKTSLLPVWEVKPDSVITGIVNGNTIEGWAWGHSEIVDVKVSIDKGETWRQAHLSKRTQYSWQRFSMSYPEAFSGKFFALSCAKDENGSQQPRAGTRNSMTHYQIRSKADI